METKLLFPNQFKRIGWVVLIPSTILGILILFFNLKFKFLDLRTFTFYNKEIFADSATILGFVRVNFTVTLIGILFLLGAIFVAFSKEKIEDEFIAKTRMESLLWAVYVNYAILILCFLFIFGFEFLDVMIFNMFTILIIFISRYYYILNKAKKTLRQEK